MNKYKNKPTRELLEMTIDLVQDTYAVIANMPQRLESIETKLD